MFAIAVWDERPPRSCSPATAWASSRSTSSRERVILSFSSSELKAVLASGLFRPDLDYDAIDAYLTLGYFPGAADAAQGNSASSFPGHVLTIDETIRVGTEHYWTLSRAVSPSRCRWEEASEQLLAKLEESVRAPPHERCAARRDALRRPRLEL